VQIPHARLHERAFVLRPLCDIDPSLRHPTRHNSVAELLAALPPEAAADVRRVMPLGRGTDGTGTRLVPTDVDAGAPALVCGILNVTPDSFSDGGQCYAPGGEEAATVAAALRRAEEMADEGADIIDVGGESTRPGAAPVSAEEEARRVLPVIRALRASPKRVSRCAVSVDTRNAAVARLAVEAGADMVRHSPGAHVCVSPHHVLTRGCRSTMCPGGGTTPPCSRPSLRWTCRTSSCTCAGPPRPCSPRP